MNVTRRGCWRAVPAERSAPQLLDEDAGRCQTHLDGTVHTDAAPAALGPLGAGEPHASLFRVEVHEPVRELALAEGGPGLAGPLVVDPVVACGLDDFDVGAPGVAVTGVGRCRLASVVPCPVSRRRRGTSTFSPF